MAEAIGRALHPGAVFESAGIEPLGFLPGETAATLREAGYDAANLESKPVTAALLAAADVVVDLSGYWTPPPDFAKRVESWPVRDPYRRSLADWRATRDDLVARIKKLFVV
jgi:protein-tyrosine-phosphatase